MSIKTNDARCNGSCADATQVRATRLHKVKVQGRLNEIRIAEMSDGQFFICCTDYYRAIGALGSSKAAEIKNSELKLNPIDDYKDKGYFGYRSYRVDDAATGQQMYRKNLVCTQEGKDFILANKTLIVDAIREWRGKKQYQSNDYGRAAL